MATNDELKATNVDLQKQLAEAIARAEAAEAIAKQPAKPSIIDGRVCKAGANRRDKARVAKMVHEGYPDEVIARTVSLTMEHVVALREQVKAGTLRLSPRALRTGEGSYGVKEEGDATEGAAA